MLKRPLQGSYQTQHQSKKWVLKLSIPASIISGSNWEYLKKFELQPNLEVSQQIFVLIKTSSKHLDPDEYVRLSLTSSEDVVKTFSRRLGQDQFIRLGHTSLRRLQDVFKTSLRRLQDAWARRLAQTSSRRFQDALKTSSKRLQDVFKKFSGRIIKLICSS